MRSLFRDVFRPKGSALVWAIGMLLVMSVLAVGIITAAASYYRRAVDDAYRKKAELLSQSGMTYAKQMITNGAETGDIKWYPDEERFETGIVLKPNIIIDLDGDPDTEDSVTISYKAIENTADEGYLLKVTSTAECGGITADSCGIFANEGADSWYFVGYISS